MSTITFGATTIFSCSIGAGWEFNPGSIQQEIIEKQAELGTGYWLKPAGKRKTEHSLTIEFNVSSIATAIQLIEGIDQSVLATLTIPAWGTFTRCRLSNISGWSIPFKTQSGYVVSTTLTFTQYP